MPKIKTQREENVIYDQEINSMFKKLNGQDNIRGTYDTHITKLNKETGEYETNLVIQTFIIDCRQTECLLALLWIFGRRIQEILLLKRKNLRIEDGFLIVQFRTLKRRKNRDELFEKSIVLDNPYVKFITAYLDMLDADNNILDVSDVYLFPGSSCKRKITSKAELPRTGQVKEYHYVRKEHGFMSSQKAWKIIKYLNPNAYCHLFRHSLATKIARKGFTESQLMSWFDWSTSKVAQGYVEKGSKLVEGLSKRNW
jgi:integrase